MSKDYLINIYDGVARDASVRMREPVNVKISKGETVAVYGVNGAGKSILVDTLLGRYPLCEGYVDYDFSPSDSNAVYKNVQYITFRDVYGQGGGDFCYQQRWNSFEQDDVPTVRELLGCDEVCTQFGGMFDALLSEELLDKRVVLLSSGETRKLQLVKALMENPRLLVIDNPYIGLDEEMRTQIDVMLGMLSKSEALQVMIVVSRRCDIPAFVDRVLWVDDMRVRASLSLEELEGMEMLRYDSEEPLRLPVAQGGVPCTSDEVVSFNDVSIKYGSRTVIENLTWQVRRGEVWALTGPNGSGKSTLLSMICADNLRSYACNMSLFGRRRGSGESIWDIKKHIGYVSPEMHRAYLRNLPMMDVVASGLHDSIGLYRKSTPEQMEQCREWLRLFGIEGLSECSFIKLSSGEQRLALLVRAFVKDPALLILDEPMHGLDDVNRAKAKRIIEEFARREGKCVIVVTHYNEELPSCVTHHLRLKRSAL